MEATRRHRTIQERARAHFLGIEQENEHVIRDKANVLPAKKQGTTARGALGDLNANVQAQRDMNIIGKVAATVAAFEKKAVMCRSKGKYNHVQAKVNTGLPGKKISQPSARPPLRHVESTAGHAVTATLQTRAAVKETAKSTAKDTASIPKKADPEKITTRNLLEKKVTTAAIEPILKEKAVKLLGKLKIDDPTSLINQTPTTSKTPMQVLLQCKTNKQLLIESNLVTFSELPANVEDIDAESDPLMPMNTYVKDIYRYLMELEIRYRLKPKHMSNQSFITPRLRTLLLDWLVKVHEQLMLELETWHMTVGIVDRYLQVTSNVQRNQLHLIGVTALFISCKYEEVYVPDIEYFVDMTDQAYSNEEIIRCEQDILEKLTYCLSRPTPLSFLSRFVKVAHANSKNHHLANYFVDLCVIDYSMAHYRPSELSAAAVCLSLYLLSSCRNLEDVWTPSLEYYSTYTFDHVKPIMREMAEIIANVGSSKLKSVYHKYQDVTRASVSTLPQLKSETLNKLINSMS